MKRVSALWMLPLILSLGAAARAEEVIATPAAEVAPAPAPRDASRDDRITLDLVNVKAGALAAVLTEALGEPVRFDGYMLKSITLKLDAVPRAEALSHIAAAVGGTWRRTFVWSPAADGAAPDLVRGGSVTLRLMRAPASTAATLVAAQAGAYAEGQERLPGRVNLDARGMPLIEAMASIARQTNATWAEILVLRRRDFAVATQSKKPAPRTKETVLAQFGAKPAPIRVVDPEEEEARSHLGAFAGIFSAPDKTERSRRVRKLRAAMETQNRRLDNYPPRHRTLASRLELQQLQLFLADFERLDAEQKKEVKVLVDYVTKRLAKVRALVGSNPPATSPSNDGAQDRAE